MSNWRSKAECKGKVKLKAGELWNGGIRMKLVAGGCWKQDKLYVAGVSHPVCFVHYRDMGGYEAFMCDIHEVKLKGLNAEKTYYTNDACASELFETEDEAIAACEKHMRDNVLGLRNNTIYG